MIAHDEELVELAALEWFSGLGYQTLNGITIAPGEPGAERDDYGQVFLLGRLRDSMRRINKDFDESILEEALKRFLRPDSQDPMAENYRIHKYLIEGVPVAYSGADGMQRTASVKVIDLESPENNDWLAVNQFTIVEAGKNRRPDVLVFVNGIPVSLLELKSFAHENATLKTAWNQVQTYQTDIPSIFVPNVVTVISDGMNTSMGSYSAPFEHFAPWKTIDSPQIVKGGVSLQVLIQGVFEKNRFLDLLHNFVVFSDEAVTDKKSGQRVMTTIKKVAKYHQYWAVKAAVDSTIEASAITGDKRGGVVWHTQGSGKSLEMLFYAAKVMSDPRMANPTLVFITDRNDLDDQLFSEVFAPSRILPETPVQAESQEDLRKLLKRASGGIIFTTLQKFAPEDDSDPVLSDRHNVVVVVDEAHRSQYGFLDKQDSSGRVKVGFAQRMRDALPNATYLGFTGTPIESGDKSTSAVFGSYVDVYDLTRAVEDNATVPIYYESRLVKVALNDDDTKNLDELADEITEQVEMSVGEKAKNRWARVEAIVGSEQRLDAVAKDIVEHWEQRRELLVGKGMIVAMSRRIAVRLYEKIVELRPDWHSDDPTQGIIKVIMTGSAGDPADFQPHLHPKDIRNDIKRRAKDPEDPLELVIVRDMWLTGFDSPSMHTMYIDKSMQGSGLMQAIARVNRTFRDKPGGLIVDYIGIGTNLQKALSEYSPSDRDQAGIPIDELIDAMMEKHHIIKGIVHAHKYDSSANLPQTEMMTQAAGLMNFVLDDPERVRSFNDNVLALMKAFALTGSRPEAAGIRDDVRFFSAVRAAIIKNLSPDSGRGGSGAVEIDTAISQLVNEAVAAEEVIDIYKLAGIETPELSILSDEFLDSLVDRENPNLQVGLLRKLIDDKIRTVKRTNIVQSRKFSELLDRAIRSYTNRALSTAEIIAELVELAKEMRDAEKRHEELGLSVGEAALYDAVAQNGAAVIELGDETLKKIAIDLVRVIQKNVTIDWNQKESVKAGMRASIKRLLAKYDYPPDAEAKAVELVLEQAELIAEMAA